MASSTRELWQVTRGYRAYYALSVAALAGATLAAYLGPLITRTTIDALIAHVRRTDAPDSYWISQFGGPSHVVEFLWAAAALITLASVVSGALMYIKGRWAARASEGVIRRLRDRLFDHLQHLPCVYFDRGETGDLVQRSTSDVEIVRLFLSTQVVEIGRAILLLVTVVPLMLALDWRMTAISIISAPVVVLFGFFFYRRLRPHFIGLDEAEGAMTTVLQENLSGIRVVRAFARQEFEQSKFDRAVALHRDRHYRLIQLITIFWTTSDLFVFLHQAGVLACGVYWVSQGSLSIGTLVAFLLFINIFIWPIRQMGRILTDMGKAVVALGRIQEILDEPLESIADTTDAPPQPIAGRIEFQNVNFDYGDGHRVLSDVSFQIEPGETLALLGPSGAGKSTIVQLLLRLYDGYDGRIILDAHELGDLPRKWLRDQISVIMQEPFLYSKSVRENIALGRVTATPQEITGAAEAAAVDQAIQELSHGYDTVVGERGVTLSGGQRQRIALARALLRKPAVLVLDDALSSVDTETESLILAALSERHGKQTTLLIAHRLSTIQHADRVLILDHGSVVQHGSPRQLREQPGPYRQLWELQRQGSDDLDGGLL
ncbi:MAG: ABC transporter ATP-binding protein [Pirellulaceae bacterium]|jgi:ATP-binding cassette subfamily B protein|nr:ABC transporter ATP-binding protein [Pirellulaceae bacterium]MDP7018253.1 ABC transporter ATP-binding protein [Pirellulaceae bacterium]